MTVFEHTFSTLAIWLAVLAAVAAAGFSFVRYPKRTWTLPVLAALRLIFFGLLAWCLFLPGRKHQTIREVKPRFLVAVDTSASMQQPRQPEGRSRWDAAHALAAGSWIESLASLCEIDVYPFAGSLGNQLLPSAVATLKPDGESTLLREALVKLAERYRGQDIAGCLVLTDGLDTRETGPEWSSDTWPWPIYTTQLAEDAAAEKLEPDARVDTVNTPRRISAGWNSELKAVVGGHQVGSDPVTVQLYKNDVLLQESPVQLPPDGSTREVAFQLTHPEVGVFLYRVLVPPLAGETHTNNNAYAVSVQVIEARNRLLYVEGPPRWESKYLIRVLKANPQITPACFVRGPEGAFLTVGDVGKVTADMSEGQLALFKVVVLGNLDAEEIGPQRAATLLKFVDAGGSLVLLGGPKGWGPNGFAQTDLRKLMPITRHGPVPVEGAVPVQLTDEGRVHPAFAGNPQYWEQLPPVLSYFARSAPAPGAQALLAVAAADGPQPIVVVRQYGQGKVVAIMTDSFWRWQLSPERKENRPYDRFWNQLVGWLCPAEQAVDTTRIDVFLGRLELYLGESMPISARLGGRDEINERLIMTAEVSLPDKRALTFPMARQQVVTPSGASFPGFAVPFEAQVPGLHTVVALTMVDGKEKRSDPVSFFVKPFTPEAAPNPTDLTVLKNLAYNSKGAFRKTPAELSEVLRAISCKPRTEERSEFASLWQRLLVIACLMGLLAIEWSIRKWRDMP